MKTIKYIGIALVIIAFGVLCLLAFQSVSENNSYYAEQDKENKAYSEYAQSIRVGDDWHGINIRYGYLQSQTIESDKSVTSKYIIYGTYFITVKDNRVVAIWRREWKIAPFSTSS